MAEANGNHDTRMDRIEKALELLISDHEQFRQDHKQLLIAQVIQSDEIDKLLKVSQAHSQQIKQNAERIDRQAELQAERSPVFEKRVDNLVSAIGQLVAGIPPATLSH